MRFFAAGMLALGLVLVVGVGEWLRRRQWPATTTRRLVHAGVGLHVAAAPYVLARPVLLYVLTGLFVVANGVALRREWLPALHGISRRSWGTVAFPLAVFPVAWAGWTLDPQRVFAFQVAFLVLAVADPLAAVAGRGATSKTWRGAVVFGGAGFAVTMLAWMVLPHAARFDAALPRVAAASGMVAVVGAGVEHLGRRGWDNLFVPVAVVALLIVFGEGLAAQLRLGAALGIGGIFGAVAWGLRFLTRRGAVAGGLFAAATVGFGGITWAGPAFVFFFLSSALSRIAPSRKASAERRSEKGSVRDAGQVYANGGVAWSLLIAYAVWPEELLYVGFLGALAAATADTWATELGMLSSSAPRLITTGERVPVGTSGAVSVAGTGAALLGALVLAGSAYLFAPGRAAGALGVVVLGGVGGALADSWAGATLQAQYRAAESGLHTEQSASAGRVNRLVRGYRWMNNDRVNWLCTACGALVAGGMALALG